MKKYNLKRVMPLALTATIFLSGCGEKSECDIPTRHVHKYTKQITDEIAIETYVDDEHLSLFGGYIWNEDYIEINKVDEKIYKLLKDNGLFEGTTNWNYLFNVMASKKDYLMFYYHYTTVETYTETDSEGNIEVKTRTVEHNGWTANPYDSNNTGRTRLFHHRFLGYKIVNENDKFKLKKSPAVDDIREIIMEYPYFKEDCTIEVYEEFLFNKYELGNISPYDYFNNFKGPDLDNPNLENNKSLERKRTNN